MVKITPINYNYIPKIKDNRQNSAQVQTNPKSVSISAKPFACSFLGNFIPQFSSIDLTPALNFGDITCPVCGVKTLSEDKFNSILEEAEKIDRPQDLIKYFRTNKSYIPVDMREVLFEDENLFIPNRNLTVTDYFSKAKQRAFIKRHECFAEIKTNLSDYSNSLDDGDLKSSINSVVESIDSSGSYNKFKDIFFPLVNRSDFDEKTRNYLVYSLFNKLRSASLNFAVYNIQNYKDLSPNELSKIWASKVFSNSLITHSKIHNYDNLNGEVNNSVLLCSSCSKKAPSKLFMDFRMLENPIMAKFHLQNYLSGVAKLMGESKIQSNKFYFNNFTNSIKYFSKGNIEFSSAEIDRLLTLRALTYRHEAFAPIEQTQVDIPCACCGSTLLPHTTRMDVQHELILAKNLSDYVDILNNNSKYIGMYAKDFKNIFIDIYNNNQNISQEDFLNEFYKRADYFLKDKVFDALTQFDKNIKYTEEHGTKEQIDVINLVRDRLVKYLDDGLFDDYNYSNLLKSIMAGICMDSPECTKGIYIMLNDMKTIAYMSTLITPNDKYDNADINPVFTLLFNFFKTDVATGDFLLASKKGGKGTKDNLIALCKGCNNLKTNKGVESWYTQFLSVRKNFRKQLHVIDNMAKEGMIEDYDNWAKTISETMFLLTRGRYDIRDEFD